MAAITLRLRCEVLESRRLMAADLVDPLSVAVESSAMEGLRAAEIQLSYDPRSLNIEAADIRPGAAWKEQASLVTNVDAEAGSVRIFLFSIEPIDTQRGKLVDLHFAVNEGSAIDSGSVALSHLRLNEGELESSGSLTELDAQAMDINLVDSKEATVESGINPDAQAMNVEARATNDKACSPWDFPLSESEATDSHSAVPMLSQSVTRAPELPQSAPQVDLWQLAAPLVKLKNLNLFD